ncbi:hypothetical protein CEXT_790751 [Caerostris extrusa]|uniref:Uncharacterized protein n=1 Tax=Caerostris extrusa TaxID=172846 RepID=A0AAV4VXQ1_CAEEX|nr:hypothetical protein CEXT_790751 [Caerostris extrusa]
MALPTKDRKGEAPVKKRGHQTRSITLDKINKGRDVLRKRSIAEYGGVGDVRKRSFSQRTPVVPGEKVYIPHKTGCQFRSSPSFSPLFPGKISSPRLPERSRGGNEIPNLSGKGSWIGLID